MTSKQKLKRIAELLSVGRTKLDSSQWREIGSLSGFQSELPPAKMFQRIAETPDMERAKRLRGIIAQFYKMPEQTMWAAMRTEEVSWARHVAMALIAEELPGLSDETIANLFNRDHGIVRHAKRRIDKMLSPSFRPIKKKDKPRLAGLLLLQEQIRKLMAESL